MIKSMELIRITREKSILEEIDKNEFAQMQNLKEKFAGSVLILPSTENIFLKSRKDIIWKGKKHVKKEIAYYFAQQKKIPVLEGNFSGIKYIKTSILSFLNSAKNNGMNIYILTLPPIQYNSFKSKLFPAEDKKTQNIISGQESRFPYQDLYDLVSDVEIPDGLSEEFQGESKYSHLIRCLIMKASKSDDHVLILGDTGTGKEVIAQAIYQKWKKSDDQKIVNVNCAAIPQELFESEFFGSIKGAFTGAIQTMEGFVHEANNGVLFLDEIGDLSLHHQVKLLRFIQEKKFYKVGSTTIEESNPKIIAATNRNLFSLVQKGLFREDLYYRLATFVIHVPSLADQPDDFPYLAELFWQKETKNQGDRLSLEIINELQKYPWQGNRRELRMIFRSLWNIFSIEKLTLNHVRALYQYQRKTALYQRDSVSDKEVIFHKNQMFRNLINIDNLFRNLRTSLRPIINKEKNMSKTVKNDVYLKLNTFLHELDYYCQNRSLFPNPAFFKAVLSFYTTLLNFTKKFNKTSVPVLRKTWKTKIQPKYLELEKCFFRERDKLLLER